MIASIDENLGRLLTCITDLGIERDTLVVFMNDNGSSSRVQVFNAGMRGSKSTAHEGGTRVAAFFRWPGRLACALQRHRILRVAGFRLAFQKSIAQLQRNGPHRESSVISTVARNACRVARR